METQLQRERDQCNAEMMTVSQSCRMSRLHGKKKNQTNTWTDFNFSCDRPAAQQLQRETPRGHEESASIDLGDGVHLPDDPRLVRFDSVNNWYLKRDPPLAGLITTLYGPRSNRTITSRLSYLTEPRKDAATTKIPWREGAGWKRTGSSLQFRVWSVIRCIFEQKKKKPLLNADLEEKQSGTKETLMKIDCDALCCLTATNTGLKARRRTGYWAAGPTVGCRCRSHRWAAELETQTACPTHLLLDGSGSQEDTRTRTWAGHRSRKVNKGLQWLLTSEIEHFNVVSWTISASSATFYFAFLFSLRAKDFRQPSIWRKIVAENHDRGKSG